MFKNRKNKSYWIVTK